MKKVFSSALITQILVTSAAVLCWNILALVYPFLNPLAPYYIEFARFVERTLHIDILRMPLFDLLFFSIATAAILVLLYHLVASFSAKHVGSERQPGGSPPSGEQLGREGVLVYFFFWGFFGLMLGVGLMLYLSKAWQDVLGTVPDRIPPGIMVAGSLGTLAAMFLCAFGGIATGFYRTRQWGRKPALGAGALGPVLGCLGCIAGNLLVGPNGWFVGALVGIVSGVSLGRQWGLRRKKCV